MSDKKAGPPSPGRRRFAVQLLSLVFVAALPVSAQQAPGAGTEQEMSLRRRRIGFRRRRPSRRRRCSYHARHC